MRGLEKIDNILLEENYWKESLIFIWAYINLKSEHPTRIKILFNFWSHLVILEPHLWGFYFPWAIQFCLHYYFVWKFINMAGVRLKVYMPSWMKLKERCISSKGEWMVGGDGLQLLKKSGQAAYPPSSDSTSGAPSRQASQQDICHPYNSCLWKICL